ncbi:MAG: peptidylprolyl isomerase, partial [Clostridia bacterium]|nr:peptidylprolyl isomerase [Clostridia bacterium]
AKGQLNELVALASEARKQGIALDEDDMKSIDDSMDALKSSAKEAGYYNVNKYLSDLYGKGVNKNVLRKCWELQQLANKYYEKLVESYEFDEEDFEKYVSENLETFYTYSYIYYQFDPETKTGATEDEKKAFLEAAKAKAEEFLATAKDEATFKSQIVELEKEAEKNKLTPKADETGSSSSTTTEKKDEDYLKNFIKENQKYDEDSKSAKWSFEEGRKAGDMTVLEVTKSYKGADGKTTEEVVGYQVYYLIEPAHLDETVTKDVRHILFTADTYGSEDAAKAKAEEILAQYNAGEKTAEAFGELAKKYTDDSNGDKGGLYENVKDGDMVTEFNDWIFDEKRQVGDVEIVKTSYGYHLMYHVGDGMLTWQVNAEASLKQEAYNEDIEKLEKAYPVEYDNEILVSIP